MFFHFSLQLPNLAFRIPALSVKLYIPNICIIWLIGHSESLANATSTQSKTPAIYWYAYYKRPTDLSFITPKPIVDSRRLYSRFSCRWNGSRRPTFVIWDVDYLDTYFPYTDHDWFTENNICEAKALAKITKISHTRIQIGLKYLLSLVICILKHLSYPKSVLFHLKSVLLDNLFCKS